MLPFVWLRQLSLAMRLFEPARKEVIVRYEELHI